MDGMGWNFFCMLYLASDSTLTQLVRNTDTKQRPIEKQTIKQKNLLNISVGKPTTKKLPLAGRIDCLLIFFYL